MNTRMMPTKVHAVEDYMTSTGAPMIARSLGVTPTTRKIFDSVAAVVGMQSMITDYEGGVVRVLPMKAHLASDLMIGVGLLTVAAAMRKSPTVDRVALAGLGVISVVSALMTRPTPGAGGLRLGSSRR